MAKKKQSGLGKGLDSLIPDFYNEEFDSNNSISLEDVLNEDQEKDIKKNNINKTDPPYEEKNLKLNKKSNDEIKIETDKKETFRSEKNKKDSEEISYENIKIKIEDENINKKNIKEKSEDNNKMEKSISKNLTEKEIKNIKEVKEIVDKNPRITLWSSHSAAVFRYLRKTEPEFSISKEGAVLIDEAVSKKYPEIWELFKEI